MRYQCDYCDYIYDPAIGDREHDIPPGTEFDDLPDDWSCPDCNVGKDDFTPIEED